MASLDHVYDLLKKFKKDKIEYVIITLQEGKKQIKSNAFMDFQNHNAGAVKKILTHLNKKIKP